MNQILPTPNGFYTFFQDNNIEYFKMKYGKYETSYIEKLPINIDNN